MVAPDTGASRWRSACTACPGPAIGGPLERPTARGRAYERAMARDVERLAIFTHDPFATPHDEANRAAVAAVPADELELAGIALHASRKTVDKVVDRLRPHA